MESPCPACNEKSIYDIVVYPNVADALKAAQEYNLDVVITASGMAEVKFPRSLLLDRELQRL